MVQLGFYDDQSDESAASAALVQATLIAMWWLSNFSRQAKHAAFHSGGKEERTRASTDATELRGTKAERKEKKAWSVPCPALPSRRASPTALRTMQHNRSDGFQNRSTA